VDGNPLAAWLNPASDSQRKRLVGLGGRDDVKAVLEQRLSWYAGKPVSVLVRTAKEMTDVLHANPFPDAHPNWTVAIFLDSPPAAVALDDMKGRHQEKVCLGKREIYVCYGPGMGRSKLRIPAAEAGTARNINTIAKLVELAGSL
jgi:uncharacterized protein (DUF1697 family)